MDMVSVYSLWQDNYYSRRPGRGQNTFALALTARLTKGIALPRHETGNDAVNVIYQMTEDGLGDTIKISSSKVLLWPTALGSGSGGVSLPGLVPHLNHSRALKMLRGAPAPILKIKPLE